MTYSPRKFLRAGACTMALCLIAVLHGAPALAQTPPVVDGNLNDMIQYAAFLEQSG